MREIFNLAINNTNKAIKDMFMIGIASIERYTIYKTNLILVLKFFILKYFFN